MLTDSQVTVIHHAIPYLPDGWKHNFMRSNGNAVWVDGSEMRGFRVGHCNDPQSGSGQRFHVWCSGLGNNTNGQTMPRPPEITVRIDATPEHLADEISRRFLPQYEEFYQAITQAIQEHADAAIQKTQIMDGSAVTTKLLVDQLSQLLSVTLKARRVIRTSRRHIIEIEPVLTELLDDMDQAIDEAQEWVDKAQGVVAEHSDTLACTDGTCAYSSSKE